MNIAIASFCFIVAILTSLKYWLDKDKKKYKISATILAFISAIPAYYVLRDMVPSPAVPVINNPAFYAQGNLGDFQFCFEFYARNDGETLCKLEKVEFIFEDVNFVPKKSALLYIGQGGGGGGRYSGGSANVLNEVVSSYFPQTIPSSNHLFYIVGIGASKSDNRISFSDSESSVNIHIIFHFRSKNKILKPLEIDVPVIMRQVQNIR